MIVCFLIRDNVRDIKKSVTKLIDLLIDLRSVLFGIISMEIFFSIPVSLELKPCLCHIPKKDSCKLPKTATATAILFELRFVEVLYNYIMADVGFSFCFLSQAVYVYRAQFWDIS